MKKIDGLTNKWSALALLGFLSILATPALAGGNNYSGYSSRNYSNSINFYQQSSPTRANAGGGEFSNSVYGGRDNRTRFSSQGLTGSATYSGPGSFYNTQRSSYFSAGNGNTQLKVIPVTRPVDEPYKVYWRPERDPEYYKAYWRD